MASDPRACCVSHDARDGYVEVTAGIIEPLGSHDIVDLKVGDIVLRARTKSGFVRRPGQHGLGPHRPGAGAFLRHHIRQFFGNQALMAHIQLKGISKTFGNHTALRDLDLEIADGEFFVLLGQTGAGKTTTLRLVAGLEKPPPARFSSTGRMSATGARPSATWRWCCSNIRSIPRYTVRENLEFPLKSPIRKTSPDEIKAQVDRVAKTLRIEHLMDRKVDRLSGGEMQRVSIGRAIVRRPRVFLMDEPLSALDAKLREALRTELKNLQVNLGATFLFVTHDQVEAMAMGDKIGVLNNGQLVQTGTPHEIYANPVNTFVARAVGSPPMNLINGPGRTGVRRHLHRSAPAL